MAEKEREDIQESPLGLRLSIEDFCSIANRFVEMGRCEEAVDLYEKGMKLYPKSLALKINLGKVKTLLKEKQVQEREKLLDKFKNQRKHMDQFSFQLNALGELYLRKNNHDKALSFFQLSLLHNPTNYMSHLNLGRFYYKANEFSEAIKELRDTITINPFCAEAHSLLGRSLFYTKNIKQSLNSLVDAFIIENTAGGKPVTELNEKIKYLMEKLDIRSKVARNEFVKGRLNLFNKCMQQLDAEKEEFVEKASLPRLREILLKSHKEAEGQRNLLQVAIRLRVFDALKDLSDEHIFTIGKFVKEVSLDEGEMIFDEEDHGDEIYFIESGSIKISKQTPFGEQILAKIVGKEFFGEMNFIDPAHRSADAWTCEKTTLFSLSRSAVEPLIEQHKEVAVQFYWYFWRSLAKRTREANELLKTFFQEAESRKAVQPLTKESIAKSKEISIDLDKKLKVLHEKGLSAKELRLLAAFSSEELYNRDEVIFHEGDIGDRFYIILDGKVRISKYIPGAGEEALAILEKGDFFGEMALIDNEKRSADARAHVNGTTVLTIARDVLNEILSVDIESAYQFLSILCRILTQRLREINIKIVQWRLMSGGF